MPFTVNIAHTSEPVEQGWTEPFVKVECTSIVLPGKDGVNFVIEQNAKGEYVWHKTGQWREPQDTVIGPSPAASY